MIKVPQSSPWLGVEEKKALTEVVEEEWITEGPKSQEFTSKLKELMGAPFGVFAPNGTLALYLGFLALEIGEGDEIIVPDATFIASATSVVLAGAVPVFAEIKKDTFQIDISKCEELISEKTKAIMPVHLFGSSVDMDAVMAFAKKHNLKVIEDAAQGINVKYNGKHVGTIGDIGCFSFFADKTITTGEGGFVVTNDEKIYDKLMFLRNQGRKDRGSFVHHEIGFNFRITDFQAAMGLAQLKKLPEICERKKRIMGWYVEGLKGISEIEFIKMEKGSNQIPFRVVLISPDAKPLADHLEKNEVQRRSFFYPLHKQPCFADGEKARFMRENYYVNAMYGYDHCVLLPVFPTISKEQVDYVCETIRKFYSK